MPPVIVNIPPSTGPPLWLTAVVSVLSGIVAAIVTSYVTRSREHYKWLWERKVAMYMRITRLAYHMMSEDNVKNHSLRRLMSLEEDLNIEYVVFASVDFQQAVATLDDLTHQRVERFRKAIYGGRGARPEDQKWVDEAERAIRTLDHVLTAEALRPARSRLTNEQRFSIKFAKMGIRSWRRRVKRKRS